MKLYDFYFYFLKKLFLLRFYGPINLMRSCRVQAVYLTTFTGRLRPLSTKYCAHSFATCCGYSLKVPGFLQEIRTVYISHNLDTLLG